MILLTFFLSGGGLAACGGDTSAAGELRRRVLFGGALLDVQAPARDRALAPGAARVLVRFPDEDRVLPSTFRARLNGQDVTDLLTVGGNGVAGSVYPLREGANSLSLEVFGRGLFGRAYYEDGVRIRFTVKPVRALDRARGPAPTPIS